MEHAEGVARSNSELGIVVEKKDSVPSGARNLAAPSLEGTPLVGSTSGGFRMTLRSVEARSQNLWMDENVLANGTRTRKYRAWRTST